MKVDPHYRELRCSSMTLVSRNIRFMWIFAGGSLGMGCQSGNQKRRFSVVSDAESSEHQEIRLYNIVLFSPLSPFH